MRIGRKMALFGALCGVLAAPRGFAEPVVVAVASNFARSAEQLAGLYQKADPSAQISFSAGSSGKLYAQAEHGAPFDILISADAERPAQLEQKGFVVPGSRFTYALGRIVLWSAAPQLRGRDCRKALVDRDFKHLAIANPKTAPYGAAAVTVLDGLGIGLDRLEGVVVQGENIAQTLQFVATGSAQLGFVALSQLRGPDAPANTACRWDIPAAMHPPIEQQAVLLKRGAANASARGFLAFLQGDAARRLIADHGYDLKR